MSRPRVLVVDDDESVRQFVRLGLEDDCFVLEASDAKSALAAAASKGPDLVLLDVGLPGESGLEVLVDLRDRLGAVPIVMLTGAADDATEGRSRELGATAFVAKPVDPADLRRLVLRHLGSDQLESEP